MNQLNYPANWATCNVRNIGTVISGSLAFFESLGPYDIPNTVTREQNGTGDLLLSRARDVRADHGQAHAEPQSLKITQPESHQPAPTVRIGQPDKQTRPDDTDQIGDNHGNTARVETVCVFCCDNPTTQQREELYCTPRNLEILGSESVEPKGPDDNGREAGDGSVGNLSTHCHDEEQPGLWIINGLPHLVPFEVVVLDSLAVNSHTLDRNSTLSLCEELGRRGQIGKNQDGNQANGYRKGSEDDENVHPSLQASRDVADGVSDQTGSV